MKPWLKLLLLVCSIMAFGWARLGVEARLSRDLRAGGLIRPKLELESRDRIGQTSSAVALGGLRTLVASFLNLRAYTAFTQQRWGDLAKTFDAIVDLAPHTRYYWETGSWHLAYNAAGHFINDSDLPPLRRREAWRTYILKGRLFLERGIRNNPEDPSLWASLGFLLSDPNKFPAFRNRDASFATAADAYRKAAGSAMGTGYVWRAWCYSLARVPGKEREALALAHRLYAAGQKNRTPTLVCLMLVLEAHDDASLDVARRAVELWGSEAKAYEELSGYWRRTRDRFPVYGVSSALASLEKSLPISKEASVLNKDLPPPPGPDDWFHP